MAGKSMINEALDIVSANIEPISFKELGRVMLFMLLQSLNA